MQAAEAAKKTQGTGMMTDKERVEMERATPLSEEDMKEYREWYEAFPRGAYAMSLCVPAHNPRATITKVRTKRGSACHLRVFYRGLL